MKKLLLICLLAAISCGKDTPETENRPDAGQHGITHGMIVLGDRLEDPYSVDHMSEALRSLYPTKTGLQRVVPTDYYVRFLPRTEEEYGRLLAAGLWLQDHPVDYRIVQEGDYYHDPAVPEGDYTWQYTVVPTDFAFPDGIPCEVLDECYLPEHDPQTKADTGIDWLSVEREAYRLSGNGDAWCPGTKAGDCPKGRIAIVDDEVDDEPAGVKGVLVCCNSFVKFSTAYTDEEGYYELPRAFSSHARYRLVFQNVKGFSLGFNLVLVPGSVSTLGEQSPSGVSIVVDKHSERKLFTRCVVNNAGYDYWDACEGRSESLSTPPGNFRLWLFPDLSGALPLMLQQGVLVDNTIVSEWLGEYATLVKRFLPDALLGLLGASNYRTVYAAATKQFAHASHYMQAGTEWWDSLASFYLQSFVLSGARSSVGAGTEENAGYCELAEMWAGYLQTLLMRERYGTDMPVYGASHWFFPQLFLYLDERGLDRFKIFAGLTSDVTDKQGLQQRLQSLYPEYRSTIAQAFARYQ
ncbi:MAG: hypothetical protein J5871_05590 [Bacteroidales bacterium]|nr:hypothetical protein [Bacteroidales bacterium]